VPAVSTVESIEMKILLVENFGVMLVVRGVLTKDVLVVENWAAFEKLTTCTTWPGA
jgi:hypothetical protein